MNRRLIGKSLLTLVLAGGALTAFLFDWNTTHVFNPVWPPHARYHGAVLLFFLSGVAGVANWLLWRPSREPRVAVAAAACFSLAYWTPYFYVPVLDPMASYSPPSAGPEPHIAGIIVHPNLVIMTIFILITAAGWWLARTGEQAR
jgi:hypothetical protein